MATVKELKVGSKVVVEKTRSVGPSVSVKQLNAIRDGQMNRAQRRAKEKRTGVSIIPLNKPYVKPETRKKS